MSEWSYDSLAAVYATDMGASMPFDDVGWYIAKCRGRRTLELGCGTGRILLELLAAGVDAVGVDRSLPMLDELRRLAAQRGLIADVSQADLHALPIAERYDCILAPYALITYVSDRKELRRLLQQLAGMLTTDGRLIVDSFVPQPVTSFSDFRDDYRRRHGDGWLHRSKRITALDDGRNRIERRYRLLDAGESLQRQWTTCDEIRPYSENEVCELATAAELTLLDRSDDYGQTPAGRTPRFWTLVFRAD